MNLRLLWQAWKVMVILCMVLATSGLIAQRNALIDAAFSPLFAVSSFLVGLVSVAWWERRGRKP
jgi:hypothetical protein